MPNLTNIRPVGDRLIYEYRQTDVTKLIGTFHDCANTCSNFYCDPDDKCVFVIVWWSSYMFWSCSPFREVVTKE